MDGVNILNPFIFPRAFLLWSEDLIQERTHPNPEGLDTADRFLYKTQRNVLSGVFHVGIVGGVIRALANNLMKLNIFIASEWKDFILCNLEKNKNKVGQDLGAAQAFFIIPVMVTISFGNILYRSALKFRSEICFSVILATSIVIFTTYI